MHYTAAYLQLIATSLDGLLDMRPQVVYYLTLTRLVIITH